MMLTSRLAHRDEDGAITVAIYVRNSSDPQRPRSIEDRYVF